MGCRQAAGWCCRPPALYLALWGKPAITFGTANSATVQLLRTASDATSNLVTARAGGETLSFTMQAPGPHMAMNAGCALAVAAALDLDVACAAAALEAFAPVVGRGSRRTLSFGNGEIILLDESYNASAASVRAALSVLELQQAARRIAVLGDMLELGEHAAAEHMGLAEGLDASADLVFTCGPMMRRLHDAVPAGIRGAHAPDAAALAPIVAEALRAGDAVLVKGSLGSRMKLVVQAIEARG